MKLVVDLFKEKLPHPYSDLAIAHMLDGDIDEKEHENCKVWNLIYKWALWGKRVKIWDALIKEYHKQDGNPEYEIVFPPISKECWLDIISKNPLCSEIVKKEREKEKEEKEKEYKKWFDSLPSEEQEFRLRIEKTKEAQKKLFDNKDKVKIIQDKYKKEMEELLEIKCEDCPDLFVFTPFHNSFIFCSDNMFLAG